MHTAWAIFAGGFVAGLVGANAGRLVAHVLERRRKRRRKVREAAAYAKWCGHLDGLD